MKFSCSQAALAKAVNTVSKAVSAKTTMPVLKGILLQVEENQLFLTASNLDLSLKTSVEIQGGEEGAVVVNAKIFGEIIRRLPNAVISARLDAQNILSVSCLGSSFQLVTLPSGDFPSIGVLEEGEPLLLRADALCRLIDLTSYAASIDEKKGILTGCLLSLSKDSMKMVAVDGFRMAIAEEAIEGSEERSVIIPAKSLSEIGRILSESSEEEVRCFLDEKKIQFSLEGTTIVARLLEGEYIRYAEILPQGHKTSLTVSREELQSSIERASLLAKEGKNNLIKLTVQKDQLLIQSRSEEGNVSESVSVESEGDELVIGFNSKYILDALKVLPDEEIRMEFNSPVSASLIRPLEGDAYTCLVLPVRIAAY